MITPAPTPGRWMDATITSVEPVATDGAVLRLAVAERIDHLPGQHYVIRLRAADGYTAQRSYSIASSPTARGLELFVERLPDGEVSGWLAGEARAGDVIEVRGPIGGWFVWDGSSPALAIGGGSGIAPIMAMLRLAVDHDQQDRLQVVAAARTLAELPYADELAAYGATVVLSREPSPAGRRAGRLSTTDLQPLLRTAQTALVCGSPGFAEAATSRLTGIGVQPGRIRVERFGPTG